MSKENESKIEKIEKVTEVVKEKGDDLKKQVANIAFTVRKIKDWMEEKMGADIDGNGRIGSGPYKKALVFLLIAGMAATCIAEDKTAIAYWSDNAKITSNGFEGDAVLNDNTINNVTIRTNATVGGNLTVTGVITGSIGLANTYMLIGNSSGKSAANTPAAVRTNLSLVVGSNVQAYDADLTTWAGITPSANAQALLLLTYAAMRTNLNLVIGTDVQAYDADLTTWAGISPSANAQALLLLTYAAMRTNLNLVIGTDVQAYDAQLDTWSGVTPSTDGQALVALENYDTMRTNIVGAGTVTASMLDPTIVTNVLADGMVLPAVGGSAVTNIVGDNIASGDIAAARIATALGTSAGSLGGNIPAATLTNACGVGATICSVTNKCVGYTNVITFFGTVSGDLAP